MMNFLLALLFIFCLPRLGFAAIAFDASSGAAGAGLDTVSWSHTTTGSNLLMLVCPSSANSTAHSSVTYNSVAMDATIANIETSTQNRTSQWRLTAPATGTHTVTVIFGAAENTQNTATTWTGTHQTVPVGTSTTLADVITSISVDVTSASGEVVVDCFGYVGSSLSITSGQTNRVDSPGGASANHSIQSSAPGAGTVTMSYSWDASFEYVALIGTPVKPAAAAAGTVRHRTSQ